MNAIKRRADGHRELIIMFVAIPIGARANALSWIGILLKPKGRAVIMEGHLAERAEVKQLKRSRPKGERINTIRQQVWQDYAFPASHFAEMTSFIDEMFGIYPLLIYPCKVIDQGGMIRRPVNRGKNGQANPRSTPCSFWKRKLHGKP